MLDNGISKVIFLTTLVMTSFFPFLTSHCPNDTYIYLHSINKFN